MSEEPSRRFRSVGISLSLAALALGNMLLGFVQNWYITTTLGLGVATDAFNAGLALPQFLLAVAGNPLGQVILPILAASGDRTERREAAGALLFVAGVLAPGIAALLMFAAPFWVPLTVPGFSTAAQELTVTMARIHLLGLVFAVLFLVQRAFLNASERFLLAEFGLLAGNLIGVSFLWYSLPRFGPTMAAWALTMELGLPVLFVLPLLGIRARWSHPAVRQTGERLRPLLLGTAYYKTELLLDRALASLMPTGSLSLHQLSIQLYSNGLNLANKALVTPVVPGLARHAARHDWPRFHRMLARRGLILLAFGIGVTLLLALVGRPVLLFVFARGRLTPEQVGILFALMLALTGYWLGALGGSITSSAFYARGDTRFPTRLGAISHTISIPLKILAAMRFGLFGLAAVVSLQYTLNLLAYMIALRRGQRRETEAGTP
ncbi:MAG: lipid II flippase MurJ [Capsulimonadales bacterium]|nr:lipid II flippase MurJ [Capsulimonadales bacterium]